MSLSLSTTGSARWITVCGEVDMSNAHLLVELVEHLVDLQPSRLVLDLSEVTFFGAHGVSALLQAQSTATRGGVPLTLTPPSPCVAYILAVTDALGEFEVPPNDGVDQRHAHERREPAGALARIRAGIA
ncbi:STAS domain-containing protein [Micromonospora sp. ZYX-F-536]|uniref:STAS domain-containing protein n=1 Tax=Micromonospora sp. ZYX-F-536 TaxID=3457629 RepID=UPI0040407C90